MGVLKSIFNTPSPGYGDKPEIIIQYSFMAPDSNSYD